MSSDEDDSVFTEDMDYRAVYLGWNDELAHKEDNDDQMGMFDEAFNETIDRETHLQNVRKVTSLLQNSSEFPAPVRRQIKHSLKSFLFQVEESLRMCLDFNVEDEMMHNYGGRVDHLYADTDVQDEDSNEMWTEDQLTTAIDYFPRVLKIRRPSNLDEMPKTPILAACGYLDTISGFPVPHQMKRSDSPLPVSFVPLLAKLAIKHKTFDETLRGGLLTNQSSDRLFVLRHLVRCGVNCLPNRNPDLTPNIDHEYDEDDFFEPADYDLVINTEKSYLNVLKQLREMNLFRKEDIQEFDLLRDSLMCNEPNLLEMNFSIFKYLVKWDPEALKHSLHSEHPVLHRCIHNEHIVLLGLEEDPRFEAALHAGLRYFPQEIGFYFHTTTFNNCYGYPYRENPHHFGYNLEDLQEKLKEIQRKRSKKREAGKCKFSLPSRETLLSAATDDAIHLDSLYEQLCHDPALIRILQETTMEEWAHYVDNQTFCTGKGSSNGTSDKEEAPNGNNRCVKHTGEDPQSMARNEEEATTTKGEAEPGPKRQKTLIEFWQRP